MYLGMNLKITMRNVLQIEDSVEIPDTQHFVVADVFYNIEYDGEID